jgi:carnitine O-acetyltransferase
MVELWDARGTDVAVRRRLLAGAVDAHAAVADRARRGQGTDRHLLALASVARRDGLPVPSFFTDPAYAHYSSNLLSTSTVALPFAHVAGFGAVHADGYGLGYMVQDDAVAVCISAFRGSATNRGAGAMAAALEQAIGDVAAHLPAPAAAAHPPA